MILPGMIIVLAIIFIVALIGLLLSKKPGRDNSNKTNKNNRYKQQKRQDKPQEPKIIANEAAEYPEKKQKFSLKKPSKEVLDDDTDTILGLKSSREETKPTELKNQNPDQVEKSLFIVLHLMAPKDRPYSGYELLQSLLAVGLRYGKMQIFHRHEKKTGIGKILFSLASAIKPGTFDLPRMGSFSCSGLTVFMDASLHENPMAVFNLMLDTIGILIDDLGGVVQDDHRELLTKEKVVMIHKQIRQLEQERVVADTIENW